jgi:signal peptidase I
MEDPASSAAPSAAMPSAPSVPPVVSPTAPIHLPNGAFPGAGSAQAPYSVEHDRLAESMALEDATGEMPVVPGPAVRPSTPGGPARHAADRTGAATTGSLPNRGDRPDDPPGSSRFGRTRGPKRRHKAPWWELPLLIVIAVVVAMLIKTFVVQPYYIPSESMENTLYGCSGCSGDRILVNKPIYDLRDPHPGDIVVFKAPQHWDNEPVPTAPSNPLVRAVRWVGQVIGVVPPDENDLVKRVIATGGQTVRCCDANGNIQVSDSGPSGPWRSLNEPYIYQNLPWDPTSAPGAVPNSSPAGQVDQRNFGPVTIPKGRLWVMGDHRSVSEDSRWHYTHDSVGDPVASTVPINAVIGKAVLIVWPPSRWRTLGTPQTFKTAAAALGGPVGPPLAGFAVVLPAWALRRRRRRW